MGIITSSESAIRGSGAALGTDKLITSRTTDTPGAPAVGARYIVPVGATGAFSTHDTDIATWNGTVWSFLAAEEGWQAYVDDADESYQFDGTTWQLMSYDPSAPPATHAPSHEDGGGDELPVENLPTADAVPSNVMRPSITPGALRMSQLSWTDPVISILDAPPGSPSVGDRYRCNAAPTGAWTGWANRITEYTTAGTWVSFIQVTGEAHYNVGSQEFHYWDITVWKVLYPSQHSVLTGVSADQHHAQVHAPDHWRIGSDPLHQFNDMLEPTGFEDAKTGIILSWSDGAKTLTLTPTGASFDVWVQNKLYAKIGAQTKDISGSIAEGLWFFYYDNAGVLQASQTPWSFKSHAPVALVQWDAANLTAILVAWELHGLAMDWSTHEYLHDTVGMVFESGLITSGDIAGTGADADDAQVAVADGHLHDEDLEIDPHDGAGSGLFEQELSPTAEIPVYYRDGAGGNWRKVAANTFPVKQGAARIQYNLDTAGTWSTPDVTSNGRYMAMWLFATNNMSEPVIAILGQREDITFSAAQDNNQFPDLLLGSLPTEEMKILARVILQTSSTYANTPHARTREILDLREAFQQPTDSVIATDHQSLSGRDSTNAHPATAVALDTVNFDGLLSTEDNVQDAIEALDDSVDVLTFTFLNNGAVLNTGVQESAMIDIPFDCEIQSVRVFGSPSGSIVVDIWKDIYANYPPTDADTITASAPPTVSGAVKSEDSTLVGWTKTLTAGDILLANIDSVSNMSWAKVVLRVKRK